MSLVTDDLNSLISLTNEQIDDIVKRVMKEEGSQKAVSARKLRREKLNGRLAVIDKIIPKLYADNAEDRLDDERLSRMVDDLQKETQTIKAELTELSEVTVQTSKSDNYKMFFELIKRYSHIEELDRNTLLTFIDRIEVGPKILPEGKKRATHENSAFEQSVRIFYKFVGEMSEIRENQ